MPKRKPDSEEEEEQFEQSEASGSDNEPSTSKKKTKTTVRVWNKPPRSVFMKVLAEESATRHC